MKKYQLNSLVVTVTIFLSAIAFVVVGGVSGSVAAAGQAACAAFLVPLLASAFVERGASYGWRSFGQLGSVGDLKAVEAEYKKVQSDLKQVGDDLKAYAESSKKEIASHRQMSEETKAKVDELLVKQGELSARLQAAEQVLADGPGAQGGSPKALSDVVLASDGFDEKVRRLLASKGSFGIPVRAAITSTQSDDTGGYPVPPHRAPGIHGPGDQRLTVRDLLNWGPVESNSVEFVRETGFSNNAGTVSENPSEPKPESDIDFELASESVATIAHWVPASKQVLSDVGMLRTYIDGRLRYGLLLKEEAQLLNGSGVSLNINGLYTQASDYSNPGVSVTNDTAIDRLRIAMLQVQLAEYSADGFVLNPIDWTTIELTKESGGKYIFANPLGLSTPVLWGRPVVTTQSMVQGNFLTGAFKMAAQGWDREDATVTISTEDRDNFVKNMVTILAEERIALTVYRPEAFVKGDISDVSSEASSG